MRRHSALIKKSLTATTLHSTGTLCAACHQIIEAAADWQEIRISRLFVQKAVIIDFQNFPILIHLGCEQRRMRAQCGIPSSSNVNLARRDLPKKIDLCSRPAIFNTLMEQAAHAPFSKRWSSVTMPFFSSLDRNFTPLKSLLVQYSSLRDFVVLNPVLCQRYFPEITDLAAVFGVCFNIRE